MLQQNIIFHYSRYETSTQSSDLTSNLVEYGGLKYATHHKNDFLSVTVSEEGSELHSILDCDGTEYLWQGDPKYWVERALNILPYVARLTNGQYKLDGQLYTMKNHGTAMYERFCLTDQSENTLVFTLTDSPEILKPYPRHFIFRVKGHL